MSTMQFKKLSNPSSKAGVYTILKPFFSCAVILLLLSFVTSAGAIIYVNDAATGLNDGTAWIDAYTNLQDALTAASGTNEIWVATGTYRPTTDTNNRAATFQMKEWVDLYGGFNGTETNLSQRDWDNNVTVLSGDILGDDVIFSNNIENVYQVVRGATNVIIDGFVICGGRADGITPYDSGGGMYNEACSGLKVLNCKFTGNWSKMGAGMYDSGVALTISNCLFTANYALSSGAGIYQKYSYAPLAITDCVFAGNKAGGSGGAIYSDSSYPTLKNCMFTGNMAPTGGATYVAASCPVFLNCTFSGNASAFWGGALYGSAGLLYLTNCIMWADSAPSGYEIYNQVVATSIVSYCNLQGGIPGTVGSVFTNGITLEVGPFFVGGTGGMWTAGATYDSLKCQSTLHDSMLSAAPGELAGKFINPDMAQNCQYLIVTNSGMEMIVWGDLTGIATNGGNYQIYDYHLRSSAGHWESGLQTWVNDPETSPCIDNGDPATPYSNELMPNGARINMGAYGNTLEASRSIVPATILITEIMANPMGTDADFEWIEIYNASTNPIDLTSHRFRENNTNHGLDPVVIQPLSFIIIAQNKTNFLTRYPALTNITVDSSFSLGNTGELLEMLSGSSYPVDLVDAVDCITANGFPTINEGYSIHLDISYAPMWSSENDLGTNWSESATLDGISTNYETDVANPGTARWCMPVPNITMVEIPAGGQPSGPDYTFFMSKYEIRNDQFVVFLNDAKSNPDNERGTNMFFDINGNVYMNSGLSSNDILFAVTNLNNGMQNGIMYDQDNQIYKCMPGMNDHPAAGVSWYGALKYCNWLTIDSGRGVAERCYSEGSAPGQWRPITSTNWPMFDTQARMEWVNNYKGFRLPMDRYMGSAIDFGEFYKAAAWDSFTNHLFGFGRDTASAKDANYQIEMWPDNTTPVGYYNGFNTTTNGITTTIDNSNIYGLYDLSGNVAEWNSDTYISADIAGRAARGGHWGAPVGNIQANNRIGLPPSRTDFQIGFRVLSTYMDGMGASEKAWFDVYGIPSPIVTGQVVSVTVTARQGTNVWTDYTGTVYFSSMDTLFLPSNYTFQISDNGTHIFTNSLAFTNYGENAWVEAADMMSPDINGRQEDILVVNGFSINQAVDVIIFGIRDPVFTSEVCSVSVALVNLDFMLVTNYTGTVEFTSSDTSAVLPGVVDTYTFSLTDGGWHTFTNELVFNTIGEHWLKVQDLAETNLWGRHPNITVQGYGFSTNVTHFVIEGMPEWGMTNDWYDLCVEARNELEQVVTGYVGVVTMSSSDTNASYPPTVSFTGPDEGVKCIPSAVQFMTTGNQWIEGTWWDGSTNITGIYNIYIDEGFEPKNEFEVILPRVALAGQPVTFTIEAILHDGSVDTNYVGMVEFFCTDPGASCPSNCLFTTNDFGVKVFTNALVFSNGGTHVLNAWDQIDSDINGDNDIRVFVGGATNTTHFALDVDPLPVLSNMWHDIFIVALDDAGLVNTSHTDSVTFLSSDAGAVFWMPSFSNFVNGMALITNQVKMMINGDQTITAISDVDTNALGETEVFVLGCGRMYYVSEQTGWDGDTGLTPTNAWQSINYAASMMQAGDVLIVEAGCYMESVFINISGTPEAWIGFVADEDGRYFINDGPVTIEPSGYDSAFTVNYQSYIAICGFERLTENTVGDYGIAIMGANNIRLYDNEIQNCDCGILVSNSMEVTIQWNEVEECPTYGIFALGATGCFNLKVEGNYIGNCGTAIKADCISSNIFLLRNRISLNGAGIVQEAGARSEISENNISENNGIGIKLRGAGAVAQIHHNLIYRNVNQGISMENASAGSDIINNTFYENEDGIFLVSSPGSVIRNNIIAFNVNAGINADSPSTNNWVCEYNCSYGNTADWSGFASMGSGSISSDPQFASLISYEEDFHLMSTAGRLTPNGWFMDGIDSPCIDAGWTNSTYSNEPMPNGAKINMGVYGDTWEASRTPTGGFIPSINNAAGATDITSISATLNGDLISTGAAPVNVTVYWGLTDGGTIAPAWDNSIDMGLLSVGPFSTNITGLTPGTSYYYRCYATNMYGEAWASSSTNFVTANPDADGDGMPDAWEISYFGSTNAVNGEPADDLDGDYLNNLGEYIAGTDPTNAFSVLEFTDIIVNTNGDPVVYWTSVSNRIYDLEFTTNGIDWEVASGGVSATPPENLYEDIFAVAEGTRTYRVVATYDSTNTALTVNSTVCHWLTLQNGPNGAIDHVSGWFVDGTNISVLATPSNGYYFVDWTGDISSTNNPLVMSLSNAVSLTANFAINTYDITASAVTNGTINPTGVVWVAHGSNQIYSISPDPNYHITDVIVDSTPIGATNSFTFVNVTNGGHNIDATFAIDTFTLTVTSAHGTPTPAGVTTNDWDTPINATVDQIVPDGASTQYVCTGWTGSGSAPPSGVTTNTSFNITNNSTIVWNWKTQYMFNAASSVSNGVVLSTNDWYDAGTTGVTATAVGTNGYTFISWTGDASSTNNPIVLTMDQAYSIVANFATNSWTINASAGPNGSIVPSGFVPVVHGTDTNFSIVPNLYYSISDVTVNGSSIGPTNSYTFINVTSNQVISAVFIENFTTQGVPHWWLGSYGLTNDFDGEAVADQDGDGMATWAEYIAGTDPTNAFSVLEFTSLLVNTNGNLIVSWTSVTNRTYDLESSTNGGSTWVTVSASITSTPPVNVYEHVAVPPGGSYYYRVLATYTGTNQAMTPTPAMYHWLTLQTGANGSIDKTSGWWADSTNVSVLAIASNGYHLSMWTGDIVSTNNPLVITATNPCSVTANFAINTHTLTVNTPHGTPAPAGVTTNNWNTPINATVDQIVPDGVSTQYVCTGWTGSGSAPPSGATTNTSFNITNNSTITWNWKTQYMFNASAVANGSVLASNGWNDAYAIVSATATPTNGYYFVDWTGDISSTNNPLVMSLSNAVSLTANFAINTYDVTALAVVNGTISPTGTTMVAYGNNINYSITPDPNYHITDVIVDSASVGVMTNYTFNNVTNGGHTIDATFAIDTYTLTVNTPHGTPTPAGVTTNDWNTLIDAVLSGSPVLVGSTTQYVCTGWAGTGSVIPGSGTNTSFNLTTDSTLAWLWDTNYYLTCSAGLNGSIDQTSQWSASGANVIINASPSNGCYFMEWSGNTNGCTIAGSQITVPMTMARSVTATFQVNTYTLTVTTPFGTAVPPGLTTNWNALVNASVSGSPVLMGTTTQYLCTGWAGTGSAPPNGVTTNTSFNITNNSTITWNWKTQYMFSANSAANGSVTATNGWYDAGSPGITATAVPSNGYSFVNWTGSITSSNNPVVLTMNQTYSLTANFSLNAYNITSSSGANGSVTPTGNVGVAYGGNAPFTITPSANYHILDVLIDSISIGPTNSYTFLNVTNDHTISATFAIDTYTLTVNTPHGTPTPAGVTTNNWNTPINAVVAGSPVLNGITTQYVCTGWTGTGSVTGSGATTNTSFNITTDSTLTWNWQTQYWLDTTAGANGTVNVADSWRNNGSVVNITPTGNAGYHFAGWTGDVPPPNVNDSPLALTMDSAKAVTATFAVDVGSISVTIAPSQVNAQGAKWRLTTGPDTTWHNSGDTVSGLPGTGAPYTITFNAIAGWSSPANISGVGITDGGTTTRSAVYVIGSMSLINGGTFIMGIYYGEGGHQVTLSSFYMDVNEVTVGAFQTFCEAIGYPMPSAPSWGWGNTSLPMVNVTWNEAAAYAVWAGKRLPTEAEYEYAMRSGAADRLYPWGGTINSANANYFNFVGQPRAAGSYTANAYGLFDIAGNVWEWCSDWHQNVLTGPVTDPKGPTTGLYKIIRGGGWASPSTALRCALRFYLEKPNIKYVDVGFRCVRSASAPPADGDINDNGIPDWWEMWYFGLENGGTPSFNALADPDGDGMNNSGEYTAGTSPLDSSSLLKIDLKQITSPPNSYVIRWPSAATRFYTVERSTNLTVGFSALTTDIPAVLPINSYTDTVGAAGSYFYRVRVQ